MTREEREDAINCFKNKLENEVYGAKYNKLAIEALEQEPIIKNDLGIDCISRSRAIERLKLNFPISDGADNSRDRHRYMQALADIQAIRELPSVTPQEPRKGHWKLVQRGKYIDICCSNCEAVRIKEYAYNYTIDQIPKEDIKECFECVDMSYCPNCGSDNRKVEV